jgi:hypothetical protein
VGLRPRLQAMPSAPWYRTSVGRLSCVKSGQRGPGATTRTYPSPLFRKIFAPLRAQSPRSKVRAAPNTDRLHSRRPGPKRPAHHGQNIGQHAGSLKLWLTARSGARSAERGSKEARRQRERCRRSRAEQANPRNDPASSPLSPPPDAGAQRRTRIESPTASDEGPHTTRSGFLRMSAI